MEEKKRICIIGKKDGSEEGLIGFRTFCIVAIAVAALLVAGLSFLLLRGKSLRD